MRAAAPSPRRRLLPAVAAVTLTLLILLVDGWLAASPAGAQPNANSVTVTVLQVTPTTPIASAEPRAITVVLRLTNTTEENLGTVEVDGARGNPIGNQTALDAAIAKPQPPDPTLLGKFTARTPATATLGAGASATLTYASTTASSSAAGGLCLCENRIYPLYFTVHQLLSGGKDVVLGSTQTYLPSFTVGSAPQHVRVSWVWPILDQPHRGVLDSVFVDDELATSVAPGGRLDRVLQVVEQVGPSVPLTLLIDPDLIDELAVMASGKYSVVISPGHTGPGAGSAAAAEWLLRLRTALDADPGLAVSFTPYADPDVNSLRTNGLDWSTAQSDAARMRVSAALGDRLYPADIAWPLNSVLSPATLSALAGTGTSTVIVDDSTLPGGRKGSPLPDALATVATSNGPATMAVTSAAIERFAAAAVTRGKGGLAALPKLVSEVAVRAIEDPSEPHYVLITPPRSVDPDPATTAAAILQTASTSWSQPLSVREAARTISRVDHGKLVTKRSTGLPTDVISTAQFISSSLPGLASMIPAAAERAQLFGSLPEGVQRSTSSEWSTDPATAALRARAVRRRVTAVTANGVLLVRPTNGTYTLGSADSPLPITITNTLAATVNVRVQVSTVGGLPGFSADDVGLKVLPPKTKLSLHIPVHIDRAGRIKVQVDLTTPQADRQERTMLGRSLVLSVRSTALGYIGKIITFVAGGVLAAALLFRVLRRWRSRGHAGPEVRKAA